MTSDLINFRSFSVPVAARVSLSLLITCASFGGLADVAAAGSPTVQFDVPPVLVARPAQHPLDLRAATPPAASGTPATAADATPASATTVSATTVSTAAAASAEFAAEPLSILESRVAVDLQLSTLITSPTAPPIDQMLIEVDLLDPGVWVDDFSPRTQLASRFAGDIAVEQSEEDNSRLGFNLTGEYSDFLHGDLGGEVREKQAELRKFQEVAPLEIVAASGTINRGKGVFFKLRSTPTHVLEGDKPFSLVLRVPVAWRGGLLRVRATAQVVRRGLPGMPRETTTVGDEQFLVAVHLAGDLDARQAAMQVVAAERQLRIVAYNQQHAIRERSTPNFFHQVATALDLAAPRIASDWMQRTVFGSVDAHHDAEVRRLPVDVRVAVLEYQDAKQAFRNLATSESTLVSTRD